MRYRLTWAILVRCFDVWQFPAAKTNANYIFSMGLYCYYLFYCCCTCESAYERVCVLAHVITRTEIHVCLIMKFGCEQNRDLMWFLFHSKAFNSACVCVRRAVVVASIFDFALLFCFVLFCLLHSRLSIFIDYHWRVRYWLRASLRVLVIYCTLRSRSIDHLFSLLLQQ